MDNRDKAAGRKRQPEGANIPANKRFKSAETVSAYLGAITNELSSNGTVQQPMKIHDTRFHRRMKEENKQEKLTDLNAYYIEHLSLTDLLNVANSNQQLKPAADLVFMSHFGKRFIKIDVDRMNLGISEKRTYSVTTAIPWSFRLKLLRCFGHLITRLKIAYKHSHEPSQEDSKRAAQIDCNVNKYCAESLVEIEFENCAAHTLNDLKKPFSTVESVHFTDCEIGSKLSELDKWFPKVQRLEFYRTIGTSDGNDIAVHFAHLQHLGLYYPPDEKICFNEQYFVELLRLNPNLRSLCIGGCIDAKYLQSVRQHLQHLESLDIYAHGHFSDIANDTVHFPNVKKLTLRNVVLEQFPLTFNELESLDVVSTAMDRPLADFISKHKTLTKLTYLGRKRGKEGVLSEISSPALVEVDFGHCIFPIDEVISFMDICTSLKKLT
ncbi:uncharacterized protein LOC129580198, partial [Sitodiplosis mosellana]|uniref:uncharacterized protein LOC129580198 n=1 Tax=Sitodiplosis mosellana TaxID=263140 RepID=UPI002444FDE6